MCALVLAGGDPEAALAVTLEWCILAAEVDWSSLVTVLVAALGEGAGTCGQVGLDRGILLDPVGEGILTVLNDAARCVLAN